MHSAWRDKSDLTQKGVWLRERSEKSLKLSGLPLTMREMQMILSHKLTPMLVTSLIAGVVLSILAPFTTGNFSMGIRLIYWVGLCMAGGLGAAGAEFAIAKLGRSGWLFSGKPWPNALWQSLGASLSVLAFSVFIHRPRGVVDLGMSLFYIWVIAMVICSFGALLNARKVVDTPKRAALYERLKPSLRSAEIYALSAEDHYVRVFTSAGEDLILMRLSDAVAEVAPLPGLSPHRSWWVAEAGVDSLSREGGKAVIALKSGGIAPISRNGAKIVREAGWL